MKTHPLPGVDETLAQLTVATVMSKLDVNSGFWQIPLAEESVDHIYYAIWELLF